MLYPLSYEGWVGGVHVGGRTWVVLVGVHVSVDWARGRWAGWWALSRGDYTWPGGWGAMRLWGGRWSRRASSPGRGRRCEGGAGGCVFRGCEGGGDLRVHRADAGSCSGEGGRRTWAEVGANGEDDRSELRICLPRNGLHEGRNPPACDLSLTGEVVCHRKYHLTWLPQGYDAAVGVG